MFFGCLLEKPKQNISKVAGEKLVEDRRLAQVNQFMSLQNKEVGSRKRGKCDPSLSLIKIFFGAVIH